MADMHPVTKDSTARQCGRARAMQNMRVPQTFIFHNAAADSQTENRLSG
jgi:hypothetical protein